VEACELLLDKIICFATPPHKSPDNISCLRIINCIDFIDSSSQLLGNTCAPKMDCADTLGGLMRALPGLSAWEVLSRPHPYETLSQRVAVPVTRDKQVVESAAI
jgi:hypothetical protein